MSYTITPNYTYRDIKDICSNLTSEGQHQAELYGITGILEQFIVESCHKAQDVYTVYSNNYLDTRPVALCGVHWSHPEYRGDYLWLMITECVREDYRAFRRVVKGWLSEQVYPLIVTIPSVSTETLRMVTKWGFRPLAQVQQYGIPHVVLQYLPEELTKENV